jgi:hypothetical protein
MVMHEEYGYRGRFRISIWIQSSCLAKERWIPVIAKLNYDLWGLKTAILSKVYRYTSTGMYHHNI